VAWLSVLAPPSLSALQSAVEAAAVAAVGIEPEGRPFHAHLTLARPVEAWPRAVAERFAAAAGRPFGEAFAVRRGVLVESHLGAGGSRYEAVEGFPLHGGEAGG
jgi:2'-5' RNA ligase